MVGERASGSRDIVDVGEDDGDASFCVVSPDSCSFLSALRWKTRGLALGALAALDAVRLSDGRVAIRRPL